MRHPVIAARREVDFWGAVYSRGGDSFGRADARHKLAEVESWLDQELENWATVGAAGTRYRSVVVNISESVDEYAAVWHVYDYVSAVRDGLGDVVRQSKEWDGLYSGVSWWDEESDTLLGEAAVFGSLSDVPDGWGYLPVGRAIVATDVPAVLDVLPGMLSGVLSDEDIDRAIADGLSQCPAEEIDPRAVPWVLHLRHVTASGAAGIATTVRRWLVDGPDADTGPRALGLAGGGVSWSSLSRSVSSGGCDCGCSTVSLMSEYEYSDGAKSVVELTAHRVGGFEPLGGYLVDADAVGDDEPHVNRPLAVCIACWDTGMLDGSPCPCPSGSQLALNH